MEPTLIVVCGPPGSGKTTLAHRLAVAIGCPAICRDEIKEGMAHATPDYVPHPGDELTYRTLTTFFDAIGLLVDAGVSLVAEAAFQDHVWRPRLDALADRASIRIIECTVTPQITQARIAARLRDGRRGAHDDQSVLGAVPPWVAPQLKAPTIRVDTTEGYQPQLPEIIAFAAK